MTATKMENRALAKSCRAALAKTSLDVSQLEIHCTDGNVELSGKVRIPRSHTGHMDLKKEVQSLKNHMRQIRGVRDVFDARLMQL